MEHLSLYPFNTEHQYTVQTQYYILLNYWKGLKPNKDKNLDTSSTAQQLFLSLALTIPHFSSVSWILSQVHMGCSSTGPTSSIMFSLSRAQRVSSFMTQANFLILSLLWDVLVSQQSLLTVWYHREGLESAYPVVWILNSFCFPLTHQLKHSSFPFRPLLILWLHTPLLPGRVCLGAGSPQQTLLPPWPLSHACLFAQGPLSKLCLILTDAPPCAAVPEPLQSQCFKTAGLERGKVRGEGKKEETEKIKQIQLLFVSKTLFLTQQASHPMKHDKHEVLYKEDNYKGI